MLYLVLLLVSSSSGATAYTQNTQLAGSKQSPISDQLLWQYALPATPVFAEINAQGDKIAVVTNTTPNHLLLLDAGRGLHLWNFTPPEPPSTNITCLSLAADGEYVAIGTTDGSVYILEGDSGEIIQNWSLPGTIREVALSEHGTFLVIAVAGFLIYANRLQSTFLWSQYLAEPPHHFSALTFSRIGSSFVAGTTDGHLYSIQTGDGEILWEHTFDAAVNHLSLTTDDSLLLAATENTCVIFSSNGLAQQEYNLEFEAFALSRFGEYFALAQNNLVYIYSDHQPLPDSNYTFPSPISTLALPRNGEYLLAGDISGTIYVLYTQGTRFLWSTTFNEPILNFLTPEDESYFILVTPTSVMGFLLVSWMVGFYSTQALVFLALSTIALVALVLWLLFPRRKLKP